VAGFGLLVNGISAFVLHREEEKMDAGLYAAYIHVLSDVILSMFAIITLAGVYFADLKWLDPLFGIIGSLVILNWSIGLIRKSWKEVLK
jgi:Co/Zn/Cd efflux system component